MAQQNQPGGLLEGALSLAKHAAVGLATPFTSPGVANTPDVKPDFYDSNGQPRWNTPTGPSSIMPGSHLKPPVLLEQAPAALYSLYNLAAPHVGLPQANSPYFNHMVEDVQGADASARQAVHTTQPQNALDVAAEVAGSMIVPGPKIGKVTNQVSKTAPIISQVAGHAANAAKVAGKVGAEMVLPGRQGGLGTTAAATGIGVAASEAVDAFHDDPEYASVADLTKQVMQPQKRKPWTDYMSPDVANVWNHSVQSGDQDTQQQILAAIKVQQDKDHAESYFPPKPAWEHYATEAGAAAALGLGVWATHRIVQGAKTRIQFGSELAGKEFSDSYTDGVTKTIQGTVQSDQAIRNASKELSPDPLALQQVKAKLDGVTVSALQSKIKHFVSTGQIVNSAVSTPPLAPTLEAIATDLNPAERSMLTDGLLAKSALDDWQRTGEKVQFKTKPDGSGDYSMADLQHMTGLVDTNPKLAKYADAVRDHYVKQLDYMLEKGRITQDMYNDFRMQRPNFVHMSKNVADDVVAKMWGRGADGQAAYNLRDTLIRGRATEAGAGVRAGATADPVVDLPNQWAELIHNMEINDVKKDWLKAASGNKVLQEVVKPIALGERPKNLEQVHAVWDNGQEQHYKIKDAALSDALDFTPFTQRTALSAVLNLPRKLFQQGTTGIGNPLFAGTAAVYDTVTGIMLRPKGYDLGLVNEFMNKVSKGKYNLSAFDPTMWVTAPVGAVRHAADSLTGAVANELATQLTRGSGLALETLGQNATSSLQQILARHYSNSVKSIMEEWGAAGSSPFLATLPDQVAPGMKDVAPRFASRATVQAFDDAIRGDAGTAEKVLQGSKAAWEQVRANTLARLYTGTMKSIHEGFRYQAFATNLPKVDLFSPDDMQLLASQTRRLAADIGQQGASQAMQEVTHSAAYSNIAVQTLAEIARKMKDQPVTTLLNTSSAIIGLALLRYGAMANDPALREEMRKNSDSQNAAHFKTFGGLTVNVPPELRVMTAPIFAALDYMSGMHDTDQHTGQDKFDPNLAQAVMSWIDGGMKSPEEMQQSVQDSFQSAVEQAAPITPASVPLLNAGAAMQGIDIPFSRFTGKGEAVKPQQISPLYGDGTLTNDAMTASWQHAIADVVGSGIWGYARAAMDFSRARNSGGDLEDSTKIALSRIEDQQASNQGPLQGMLFRNHDKAQSINTTESRLWYNKRDGLDKITSIMNKDILSIYTDSLDPRSAMLSNLSPMDLDKKPELLGTPLPVIGGMTAELLKALKPVQAHLGQLQQQVNDVQNQSVDTSVPYQQAGGKRLSTIEERNRQINTINEERRMYIGFMLRTTQVVEDNIRNSIGDPTFTFQNFDPDKYAKMKMPQSPAPNQGAASGVSQPTQP
jgi:hypothetical protein